MLDTQQRQDVKYFTGTEVEHTICYGKKTLFVVGIQPVEEILKLAQEHNCDHIYFGTSQTFNTQEMSNKDYAQWESMILPILDAGLWAT
jgi:nucleotide-binding universal stress UspA family protein